MQRIRSALPDSDLRFPLIAIANVLKTSSDITEEQHNAAIMALDRVNAAIGRRDPSSEDELVLLYLADFVQGPNVKDYNLLQDLVDGMKKLNIGNFQNQWSLSRFLHKRGLVVDSTRPRIDSNGGQKTLQRTAVKIDVNQLRRLTPFCEWGEHR